jgi:hypothetical protein
MSAKRGGLLWTGGLAATRVIAAAIAWTPAAAPDVAAPSSGPVVAPSSATARLVLDLDPAVVLTLGRQPVRERHPGQVPALLRAELGPAQEPHPPGPGQPRLPDRRRRRVLRLLRRRRRPPLDRLLQLRRRRLAPDRPQQRVRPHRRLRQGLAPGALAARRPGRAPGPVHAGLLAQAAVQLRVARQRRRLHRPLAGAVRGRGRRRPGRPRPRLRALRPPDPRRQVRPGPGHPPVRSRHRRQDHYGFRTIEPNSQVRNSGTFGVLRLTLRPSSYSWRFLPEPGRTFTDAGNAACH